MWDINEERFEDSPEFEEWFENTGCRDESHEDYYDKWDRRVRLGTVEPDDDDDKDEHEDW